MMSGTCAERGSLLLVSAKSRDLKLPEVTHAFFPLTKSIQSIRLGSFMTELTHLLTHSLSPRTGLTEQAQRLNGDPAEGA